MIGGILNMVSYGLTSGGAIGNLLFQWQQAGVFSYLLPFLLIFALIFAILEKTDLFGKNKSVKLILSLSIGLMALQFNFVSYFFSEIFPRMGILLSLIVVGMILLGLFFNFEDENGNTSTAKKIFGGAVVIGIIVIIYQSFSGSFGFFSWGFGSSWGITYWLERYGVSLLAGIIFVVLLIKMMAPNKIIGTATS